VATTPTVYGVTEGAGASSTTHTITFTQTTGDRVVIFLNFDSTARTLSTVGDSFTDLTATSARFHILTKVLDGSEGGTMDVTIAVASKSAWLAYNITTGTHASGTAPVFSTVTIGTSTAPDSGSLSPTGGSKKYLWLSALGQAGEEADDDTWVTGWPTNFSNGKQKTTGTLGAVTVNGSVAACEYASETATVDPAAFTVAQSLAWRAYTVAIYPNTQTNFTQTAGDSLSTLSEAAVRVAARGRTGADSLGGASTYAATILADSPTVVFPLDEASGNITDLVASKTGTAVGTPVYGATGPVTGHTAINMNTAGMFSVADHADLDLGDGPFSIEFWMQRNDITSGSYVLGKTDASFATTGYAVEIRNETTDSIRLQDGSTSTHIWNTGDLIADTNWHHVVYTRALATTAILYIDGSAVSVSTVAKTFSNNNLALMIGGLYSGNSHFAGKLAYVAVYKAVLTEAQIDAHIAAASATGGGITEAAVGVKTGGEGAAKVRTSGDSVGTLTDATARAFVGTRSGGDSLGTLTEAAARAVAAKVRTIAGESVGTLSEAASRVFVGTRTVAGSTIGTLTESAVRAAAAKARTAGDSVGTLTEAAVRIAARARTIAGESIGTLTEAVSRAFVGTRSAGDSVGTLTEAAVRIATRARTITGESIGTLSEAATRAFVATRSAGDSVGTLTETVVRAAAAKARTAAETVGTLSESAARAFVGSRAVGDALGSLSEVVEGVKAGAHAFAQTAGDTIGTLSEAAVRGVSSWVRTGGDTVGTLTEAAVRVATRARTAGDSVGTLAEAAVRAAAAKVRTTADSVGSLSEVALRAVIDRVRTAGDTVGSLSEAAVRATQAIVRAAGDAVSTLSEAVVGVKTGFTAWVATAGDAIGSLSEIAERAVSSWVRTGADSIGTLADAIVRLVARERTADDAILTVTEAAVRVGVYGRTADDVVTVISDVVVAKTTAIAGVTRNEQGDVIPNCVVDAFVSATNAFHATTTSDAYGRYSINVTPGVEYFLVAYSPTGDVYGVTARDLQGV